MSFRISYVNQNRSTIIVTGSETIKKVPW